MFEVARQEKAKNRFYFLPEPRAENLAFSLRYGVLRYLTVLDLTLLQVRTVKYFFFFSLTAQTAANR